MQPPELQAGWLTGAGGAVGQFVPQPRVMDQRGRLMLLDAAIGDGFVMLGDAINPTTLLDGEQRRAWDALGTSYHVVHGPEQAGQAASDIVDIDGVLVPWIRAHGARVIVLRPDRFVAATDVDGLSMPGTNEANAGQAAL